MNYGFQNEKDFVQFFNNKRLNEFDLKTQEFLINLFDGEIYNDESIKSWKNKMNQKTDIYIKYKNKTKGISLKYGNNNSIHTEGVEQFRRYLEHLGIPYKVIEYYISFHYGYAVDKYGKKDYSKPLNSEEYRKYHQQEIDLFNSYINKTKIIIDMIDRFLIRGTNSDYDIDALISGSIDDYDWILKYDLYDLILSNKCDDYKSAHTCCMIIGPKTRNLNGNCKNKKEKYLVCIKWNRIRDDIISFKKEKEKNNK